MEASSVAPFAPAEHPFSSFSEDDITLFLRALYGGSGDVLRCEDTECHTASRLAHLLDAKNVLGGALGAAAFRGMPRLASLTPREAGPLPVRKGSPARLGALLRVRAQRERGLGGRAARARGARAHGAKVAAAPAGGVPRAAAARAAAGAAPRPTLTCRLPFPSPPRQQAPLLPAVLHAVGAALARVPLCFRALRLEDPAMNELLPFGEYAPPEAAADSRAALEAFELERLLYRLAAAEERAERREARARRAAAREASAPRPIAAGGGAGPSGAGGGGGGAYPASWPPAGGQLAVVVGGGGADVAGEVGAALRSLRSRLSSLKLRELLGAGLERMTAEGKAAAPAAPPPREMEVDGTPPLMRLPRPVDAELEELMARGAEPPRPPPGAVDWGLLDAFGAELEELMAARREEADAAKRAEREDRGAAGAPPDEEARRSPAPPPSAPPPATPPRREGATPAPPAAAAASRAASAASAGAPRPRPRPSSARPPASPPRRPGATPAPPAAAAATRASPPAPAPPPSAPSRPPRSPLSLPPAPTRRPSPRWSSTSRPRTRTTSA
jgi:hypothetical protein